MIAFLIIFYILFLLFVKFINYLNDINFDEKEGKPSIRTDINKKNLNAEHFKSIYNINNALLL